MGEYVPLVRRLGGQVIDIAPDSSYHINPMDIQVSIFFDRNRTSYDRAAFKFL